jgi:Ca2+:H+ antiporter
MLLVMGMSFLLGGLRKWWKEFTSKKEKAATGELDIDKADVDQHFGQMGVLVNSTMLLVTCLILGLVTIFMVVEDKHSESYILPISRSCSWLMIMTYAMYILFQMVTHQDAMKEEEDEDEDKEEPPIPLCVALGLLCMATVVVAFCSELLTDSLEGALQYSGLGKQFTGIILLPIVGNACEHAAAIRFALNDRAGLAVGIAVGSSVQIAIFVYPFAVLVGQLVGNDPITGKNMDLDFGPLQISVLILSVLVVLSIVLDGSSNWLEGYMLCTAYICIALLYFYVPDPESGTLD